MSEPTTNIAPPVPNLELKVAMLLVLMLVLVGGSVVYLMYARGAFESTQELILVADDSEGVSVGMDMTFSGFPVGRVQRVELDDEGNARIRVRVPRQDAHWLRVSSIFTLERGILGNTSIRAYSGVLSDPPLADGAVRKVLAGDATAEIPKLVSAARDLIQSLNAIAASGSPLNTSLGNLRSLTSLLTICPTRFTRLGTT